MIVVRPSCAYKQRIAAFDDDSTPHFFERSLHHALGLGVERTRRLIKQQNFRVSKKRARDRNSLQESALLVCRIFATTNLFLAATQLHAALADTREHAVGQLFNEIVSVRLED